MTTVNLSPRWLSGDFSDAEESLTFAELRIGLGGDCVSEIEDPDTGAVVPGPRLPLYQLVLGLAERWWTLLHESEKPNSSQHTEAHHRLDAFTPGYVFPPIAIWSAGTEGLTARALKPDLRFQRQRFRLPERDVPWFLPREDAERQLQRFVESVIARTKADALAGQELRDVWERIRQSAAEPEEKAWCVAAGRLGFDPYDPDTPDLEGLAGQLDPEMFAELSEAAVADEIPVVREWVYVTELRLNDAPSIEMADLGTFPTDLTQSYAPRAGYEAANRLRRVLGIDPDRVVDELLGDEWGGERTAPAAAQGLARRVNGTMKAVVASGDPGQHRFRMCHALFLGWQTQPGRDRLVSPAKTWPQQAARAFAAELLAPAELLREEAGSSGLSPALIQKLAKHLRCQEQVIRDQAWNHWIRMTV